MLTNLLKKKIKLLLGKNIIFIIYRL